MNVTFFSYSVKIAPGAVVCVQSEIRGDVTIGPRTVIDQKHRTSLLTAKQAVLASCLYCVPLPPKSHGGDEKQSR